MSGLGFEQSGAKYYKREACEKVRFAYDCKYGKYVAGRCHGIACDHRAFIGMRGILGDEKNGKKAEASEPNRIHCRVRDDPYYYGALSANASREGLYRAGS